MWNLSNYLIDSNPPDRNVGYWSKVSSGILTLFEQCQMVFLKIFWTYNVCFIHLSHSQGGLTVKFLLVQFNSILNRRTIVCSNILLEFHGGGGDSILQWLFNSGWSLRVGFTCVYMLLGTGLGNGMWAMFDFNFPFVKRGRLVQYIMHTFFLIFWISRVSMFYFVEIDCSAAVLGTARFIFPTL